MAAFGDLRVTEDDHHESLHHFEAQSAQASAHRRDTVDFAVLPAGSTPGTDVHTPGACPEHGLLDTQIDLSKKGHE